MTLSVIQFDGQGNGHCLYTEAIDLASIGPLQIARATTIEFSEAEQHWEVRDQAGRILFSNRFRALCLAWEHQHFNH
jgi:hypothetical protein